MAYKNIAHAIFQTCKRFGDSNIALMYKSNGKYQSLTFDDIYKQSYRLALALHSLGIERGARVGIASENRVEWIYTSFACTLLGAVDVPVFPIITAKQEEYIFTNARISALVVSNRFQMNKADEFKDKIPSLKLLIGMNEDLGSTDTHTINKLIEKGAELEKSLVYTSLISENINQISKNDLLTIIYTSGTTGEPKGVMLTHGNLLANIAGARDAIGEFTNKRVLSYLPLCHIFERLVMTYMFITGATIALAESLETISSNIMEIKPYVMTTVPRLLETVKKKIFALVEKSSMPKQLAFYRAIETGAKHFENKMLGKKNFLNAAEYAVASKLVFRQIRERLGGELQLFISGGAALPSDVCSFFCAAGIDVVQGYGLTEASPVISVNRVDDNEIGTVGKPFFNVEVEIADDGEILVKGENVMKGYWDDPVSSEAVISRDGWLHTGDIGYFTQRGNLKITDRKKYLIVTSGGKNIAPQPIESLLKKSEFIEYCVLIGDNREHLTALIQPDYEKLKKYAEENKIEFTNIAELCNNEQLLKSIKSEIDLIQKDFAKFEKIRKFQLIAEPFSVETGELSPKQSVKRHVVESKYKELINSMYTDN